MCIVNLRVECSNRFSEMLVANAEGTGFTNESIPGTALLEVFGTPVVENVVFAPAPEDDDDGEDC